MMRNDLNNLTKRFFRYLPVGGVDLDWGCHVTAAGCSVIPANSPYPPGKHPSGYNFQWEQGRVLPEYQIIYITAGEGIFESASVARRKVETGSVILLFPGEWHRYRPTPRTGWTEVWFGLQGAYVDQLLAKDFISPQRPVAAVGLNEELHDQFIQLVRAVEAEPIGYQQVIAARGVLILATALAAIRQTQVGNNRLDSVVRKVKLMLAEQLDREVDIHRLAGELHLSYAYLRRIFKQHTNLAPHQYHLQLRINRARELLRGTDMAVKQVAQAVGFDNPYYFSRIFQKKTGQSPMQFRGGSARKNNNRQDN